MADLASQQPAGVQSNGANGASNDKAPATNEPLSADEIALYDRQIRLWGAQAQERIRSAHILLVSLRALGTEIAKNLTLAGINSLTIIDDEPVTEEDLGAQYFLREEDLGKPRAQSAIPRIQDLNPRVTVKSGGNLIDLLGKDPSYYAPYDVVIACDHDFDTLSLINTAVRFGNRPFYAAGIHGFYGYIFADLVSHEFVVERDKSNVTTNIGAETTTRSVLSVSSKRESNGKSVEVVKKQETYCPLILANTSPLPPDVLGNRRKLRSVPALLPGLRALFDFQRTFHRLPEPKPEDAAPLTTLATAKAKELQLPPETVRAEFLRKFIQSIGTEMVPTAAFVGGRLSEDVINVLGKREQPIQNFALFDGDALEGKIYSLYSTPPELTTAAGMGGMGMMLDGTVDMSGGMGGMGSGVDAFANTVSGFNGVSGMNGMTNGVGGMGNGLGNNEAGTLLQPGLDLTGMPNGGTLSGLPLGDGSLNGGMSGPQSVVAGANNAGPTSAPANTSVDASVTGADAAGL